MDPGTHNASYLETKREKLGHLFESENPCMVLALAVNVGPESWSTVRLEVESIAEAAGFSLEALHEPRLLALWDRPQFVWKLSPDAKDASAMIRSIAAMAATERVGLMRVPTERMALHPPQTLERVERQLKDLLDSSSGGLLENGPSLLHWTRG